MFRSLITRAALGLLILTMAACSSAPAVTPAPAAPVAAPTTVPTAASAAATTNQSPTALAAPAATDAPAMPAAAPTEVPDPAPVAMVSTKLNLNTATADELLAGVPGMGNRMIREFFEYRPYVSIQQFRREIGKYVDDAQVAEYEKYVYVPVAINEADAATMQQIPGLDANEAAELIAARPFASNEAFLTRLATYISADEVAVAQNYLSTP